MSVVEAQVCQKCRASITPEQITSKQAGTVRGIWLCPTCVDALRRQVAAAHASGAPAAVAVPQPAVSAVPADPAHSLSGVLDLRTGEILHPERTSAPPGPAAAEPVTLKPVDDEDRPRVEGGDAIRTLASRGGFEDFKFKRAMGDGTKGATRMRTFHARMSTGALQNMDQHINEWLDTHPDIYVKHVVATVGVFEAKMQSEEHMVLSIFY